VKVTTISVNIRFSQDTGAGSWKTVELGSEATLSNSSEDWEQSQRELYARLSEQLKIIWSGRADAQYAQEGSVVAARPPKSHWCAEHQVEFKPKQGQYGTFYSHRQGNGWCNERS
jgi:hypothetical protein